MSTHILSFLGKRNYNDCVYYLGSKRNSRPYKFIQASIIEMFKKEIGKGSQFTIFVTEKSEKINWYGRANERANPSEAGLKEILEDVVNRYKLDLKIKAVKIPDGKTKDEIWEIFDIIVNNIRDGDEVIYDVTHSFRSLPILMLIALNYMRFIAENVSVKRLIYGAFDAGIVDSIKGKTYKVAPIFDLTPFVALFDWMVSVDKFLTTGNASQLCRLGESELKPLLRESKGRKGESLRKLFNKLYYFSEDVSTCRGPFLQADVTSVIETLRAAEDDLNYLKPVKPLFDKIRDRFLRFEFHDDIKFSISVVEWCLDNGLIQQGLTLMRESIVNYVLIKCLKRNNNDLLKRGIREKCESYLNNNVKILRNRSKINRVSKIKNYNEEELLIKCKDIIDIEALVKIWSRISETRNDIDHAGWREDKIRKSNNFKKIIKEAVKDFKSLL